jgi:hypothetical protein
MSSVRSVEPSLTTTHFTGRIVCAVTARRGFSIRDSSFQAGVTSAKAGFPEVRAENSLFIVSSYDFVNYNPVYVL